MVKIKDRIPDKEIVKWLKKIRNQINQVKPQTKKGEELLKNIEAYVNDCEYWMKEGDYVKAWEVLSFAWGLLEAGMELKELL